MAPNIRSVSREYSYARNSTRAGAYLHCDERDGKYDIAVKTDQSITFQPAFLWDGSNRLSGRLDLSADALLFHFDSFVDSRLELRILLDDICSIKLHKLYDVITNGIEISDDQGRKYIFILRDPKKLRNLLKERISST